MKEKKQFKLKKATPINKTSIKMIVYLSFQHEVCDMSKKANFSLEAAVCTMTIRVQSYSQRNCKTFISS